MEEAPHVEQLARVTNGNLMNNQIRIDWRLGALALLSVAACTVESTPTPGWGTTAGSGSTTTSGGVGGLSGGSGGALGVGGTIATAGTFAAAGVSTTGGSTMGGTSAMGGASTLGGAAGNTAGGSAGAATGGAAGTAGGGAGGAAGSGPVKEGLPEGKQTKRPINMPFAKNGFLEYLPKGYGDGTKRPLLVFWAGVGENGNGSAGDLDRMYHHGPPKLIAAGQWPADRPFVVLSPQHNGQLPYDRPTPQETHDLIEYALASYDIDPSRVYLTALSSGAKGGWDYLAQYKGSQVAAAAMIAGDASEPYNKAGCSLVNEVALWDFHGTNDSEQPYSADSSGMQGFQNCPQPRKEAKFTTYDGWGHQDSFTKTYDLSAGNDIYAWLLTKTK